MTKEEIAHLLMASSRAAESAAHLVLVPNYDKDELDCLTGIAARALSFAREMGEK